MARPMPNWSSPISPSVTTYQPGPVRGRTPVSSSAETAARSTPASAAASSSQKVQRHRPHDSRRQHDQERRQSTQERERQRATLVRRQAQVLRIDLGGEDHDRHGGDPETSIEAEDEGLGPVKQG
jgi:hypothetical protein